jgi:hypothetical protein
MNPSSNGCALPAVNHGCAYSVSMRCIFMVGTTARCGGGASHRDRDVAPRLQPGDEAPHLGYTLSSREGSITAILALMRLAPSAAPSAVAPRTDRAGSPDRPASS